jgi:hypothetical protein
MQVVAQEVDQDHLRARLDLPPYAVNGQRDFLHFVHSIPPMRFLAPLTRPTIA